MTYIPEALREQVIKRASNCCEYCLIDQRDSLYTHEIDHIIPEKHRGATSLDNLCLSCIDCNRHKGSDFASFDVQTGEVTLFFHPRRNNWNEHFRLDGVLIIPLTATGRVTEFVLKLNNEMRIRARSALADAGRYPPAIQEST